jgi:hypothetical protein
MSNKLTGYLESQMQSLKLKGMLAHYQEHSCSKQK